MKFTTRVFQEVKLKYNPVTNALRGDPLMKNQTNSAKTAGGVPSLSFKEMKFARQIYENLQKLNINWKYPTKNQCRVLNVLKSNYSVSCNLDSGSGKTTALLLYCLDLKFKRVRNSRSSQAFFTEDSNSGVISPRSILLVNNSNSVISLKNKINSMFGDADIGFGKEYLPMIKYLYRSTPDEEIKQVESLINENQAIANDNSNIDSKHSPIRYSHQPCHMIIATPQRLNDILSFDMSVLPSFKYLKFIGVDDIELQVNNSVAESKKKLRKYKKSGNSQSSNQHGSLSIKLTSCELFFDKLILPKLKYDKNVFFYKYDKNGFLQKSGDVSINTHSNTFQLDINDISSDGIQTAFVNSFDQSESLQKVIRNLNKAVSKSRKLLRIGNIKQDSSLEAQGVNGISTAFITSLDLPLDISHLNFKTYVLTAAYNESTKSVKLEDVDLPDFPKSEGNIIAELNEYQDFEETYRKNFKKISVQKQLNNKKKSDVSPQVSVEDSIYKLMNLCQLPSFNKDNILFVFPDSYSFVNLFEKFSDKMIHNREQNSVRAINLNSLSKIPKVSNSKRNLAFINLHNLKGINFPYQGLNFQTIVIVKPIDILLQNFEFNLPLIFTRCMRDEGLPDIGILNAKEQFDYLLTDVTSAQKSETPTDKTCNGKVVILNDLDEKSIEAEDSMYIYRKLLHSGVTHCDKLFVNEK